MKKTSRPRLLDLFCGAGGAAMGYYRAGFAEIVGVDIAPQPNYPFTFIRADVLEVQAEFMSRFDAIHASPPCQGYTTMNNRHGSKYPRLLGEVRDRLIAVDLPYVIENVPGALRWMKNPIELTGEMFGLRVTRPRLFESNVMLMALSKPARQKNPVAVYGKNDQRRLWTRKDGSELRAASLEDAKAAMGIDWMTWDELREAIPPAYTEHIGQQLIYALAVAA